MIGAFKMKSYCDIDLKKVGMRIRNERKTRGLTQTQAGEQAFISSQYWSLIESGRERASVSTYLRITKMFGLTLDDIFYNDAVTMRLHKAFSIEGLLNGCTISERAIISETMFALKEVLERNRLL